MSAFRQSETAPAGAREARTLYEIEREWPGCGWHSCALPSRHRTDAPDPRSPRGDRPARSSGIRSTAGRATTGPRPWARRRPRGVPPPGPPRRAHRLPPSGERRRDGDRGAGSLGHSRPRVASRRRELRRTPEDDDRLSAAALENSARAHPAIPEGASRIEVQVVDIEGRGVGAADGVADSLPVERAARDNIAGSGRRAGTASPRMPRPARGPRSSESAPSGR